MLLPRLFLIGGVLGLRLVFKVEYISTILFKLGQGLCSPLRVLSVSHAELRLYIPRHQTKNQDRFAHRPVPAIAVNTTLPPPPLSVLH